MKDFKLITAIISAITLGACTSGGGGISTGTHPRDRAALTQDAIDSNSDITTMSSEILVANNGTQVARSLSRSGSIIQDGQTYTSYRLDDVTFKMGGEDSRIIFNVDNEGRIVSLGKYDRSDDFTGDPSYAISEEGVFARKGTTGNEFEKTLYKYQISEDDLIAALESLDIDPDGIATIASEHFHEGIEFMNDSGELSVDEIKTALKAKLRKEINKIKASQHVIPEGEEGHAAYIESLDVLEDAYTAYANAIDAMTSFDPAQAAHANLTVEGVDIGLKYADLGFAELTVKENPDDSIEDAIEHTYTPYVGGYGVLKIDQADLDQDRVFTGTAIAGIDHKTSGYGDDDVKEGVLVRQDNATLTLYTDGSSTLTMDDLQTSGGQHWYGVQVDQNIDGAVTFTLTGTNNITGYDLPDEEHLVGTGNSTTFTSSNWVAHEQQYVTQTDNNNRVSGNYETNLYRLGEDNEHAEATSLFSFGNEWHSNDNSQHNEVAIYGAFGSGTSVPVPVEP